MVIWDTNILALYFSGRLSSDDQIRMNGLVSELSRKKETIGIPAQVWAEFLEAASQEEAEESVKLFKSNAFALLAYDMRCAIETAEVARQGQPGTTTAQQRRTNGSRGNSSGPQLHEDI